MQKVTSIRTKPFMYRMEWNGKQKHFSSPKYIMPLNDERMQLNRNIQNDCVLKQIYWPEVQRGASIK